MTDISQSLEADLRTLFSELSGEDISSAGGSTSFFDLGFDSLFLTQAATKLKNRFGVKVTFRQLLEDLTSLDALASYLHSKMPQTAVAPSRPNPSVAGPAVPEPAPAAGHPVTVEPAAEPLGARSVVERVVNEQLRVMEQQLALLGRRPMPSAAARPADPEGEPAAAAVVAPSLTGVAPASPAAGPEPPVVASAQHGPFRQLDKGAAGGLSDVQQAHLDWLTSRYLARSPKSKEYTQRHRRHFADPRAVAGFKQNWKEITYPIVATRSQGAALWDLDGNQWVDVTMGFGVALLGHSPRFITEAVRQQLDLGVEIGPQSPLAGEVAELICEFTGMERVTFCNTGSEAVMAALRICRTVTGRTRVVVFAGAYHGTFDEVLVKGAWRRGEPVTLPIAPGVAPNLISEMTVLEYGAPQSLEWIRQHADDLAAVLVETVQSRHPDLQPKEFLQEIRRITQAAETPLIFDEVITGFRCHPGGAQKYFDIEADLATYGKIVGGGMPFGFIAGKAWLMDAFDGGYWQYGDDSFPPTGVTFFAGTFVRHPLAMAAARAMLLYLKDQGPALQAGLARRTDAMIDDLNGYFQRHQIPLYLEHFTSLWYPHFGSEVKYGSLLYHHLREKGLHIWEGRPCFLSTAHSDDDVAFITHAFKQSVAEMQAGGFLPGTSDAEFSGSVRRAPFLPPPSTDSSAAAVREVPLTEAQKEVWLASQLSPTASCAFNETCSIRFRGELNEAALRRAIAEVFRRHEGLRTVFDPQGTGQRVVDDLPLDIPRTDFTRLSDAERIGQVEALLAEEGRRQFDLEKGPLWAMQILRLRPDEHLLVFTVHHLVCDGWSYDIVITELSQLYSAFAFGTAPVLDAVTPFRDYVAWEREQRESDEGRDAEAWWASQFATLPEPLDLPTDRPRPAQRSFEGARVVRSLPVELTLALRKAGARHGATMYSMLLGAFETLLYRLSGHTDVVVGIPVAGQNWMGTDCLVGHCANLLPIRLQIDPAQTFATLLQEVKRLVLDAYDHQGVTFGTLLQKLNPPRDPSRVPLASVMFNVDPPLSQMVFEGLEHSIELNPRRSYQFDLGFNVVDEHGSLVVECDFSTDIFDSATIDRWLGHYQTLLEAVVATPDTPVNRLPVLSAVERRQVLVEWNQTEAAYPREATLHTLIAAQTRCHLDRVAVADAEAALTYSQLDARANQLAHLLREWGVVADTLVGVCVERSVDMVVAVLAVLKAGGAYVPIDPDFPADRIAIMLDDSAAPVLLTQSALVARLPGAQARQFCLDRDWHLAADLPSTAPAESTGPENLAYVIYTSGSTGRPKGVEIPHRAVVNFLESMRREPGLGPDDVLLALTTLSFDIAGLELFLPLTTGARVVVASRDVAVDPHRLGQLIQSAGITVVQATPASWRLLLDGGWAGDSRLKVLCGGEALPDELAERLASHCGELWNLYGPTETTIWSTVKRIHPGAPVTIGKPIANTQLFIVDAQGQPVPVGVAGELLIGGDGLARGYRGQPELTAEKFVPHPFEADGRRVYRTGDVARWSAAGEVTYLGRSDFQVKIRGHRIELGEVEGQLATCTGVQNAVVAARPDPQGGDRLVAYIVPRQAAPMELWMASPSVNGQSVYDDLLFEVMSHDDARNRCFTDAFHRTVRDRVLLDVGTGKDAVLARLAIDAGARKVYAVEILEEPYRQARALVEELGLQDRIVVILGDASTVPLPEKVDACVAEIIGHIGGAEGLERLLEMCRHHLKDDGRMIPGRVLTHMAAVELPVGFRSHPVFAPLAGDYVKRLFEAAGGPYDLRLSIAGVTREQLRSTTAVFEECDFSSPAHVDYQRDIQLTVTRESNLDGFLLWLEIQMTAEDVFDGLTHQKSWLPVLLPVFDPPLSVCEGDVIEARVTGGPTAGGWNKDYVIEGRVIPANGQAVSFRFASRHDGGTYRETGFYKRLFAGDQIPLREDGATRLSASALRRALLENLPDYMVPSAFVFVDSLPLTPNGKVDRKALPAPEAGAEVAGGDAYVAPRTETEKQLVAIWEQVLGRAPIGIRDNFFDLGGHSLMAVKLFGEIDRQIGQKLPLAILFSAATIESLAGRLTASRPPVREWSSLVPIQPHGSKLPLFCVHGAGGNILLYRQLAEALGRSYPLYGFQSRGLDGQSQPLTTIEAMARHYLDELKSVQPRGPYCLAGYCLGGLVAYEMARMLHEAGDSVALVALLDTYNPAKAGESSRIGALWQRAKFHAGNLARLRPDELGRYVGEKVRVARDGEFSNLLRPDRKEVNGSGPAPDRAAEDPGGNARIQQINDRAASIFQPAPYPGGICLFKPEVNYDFYPDPLMGWGNLALGGAEIVQLPVNPHAMLVEPFVRHLATALARRLDQVVQPGVNGSGAHRLVP